MPPRVGSGRGRGRGGGGRSAGVGVGVGVGVGGVVCGGGVDAGGVCSSVQVPACGRGAPASGRRGAAAAPAAPDGASRRPSRRPLSAAHAPGAASARRAARAAAEEAACAARGAALAARVARSRFPVRYDAAALERDYRASRYHAFVRSRHRGARPASAPRERGRAPRPAFATPPDAARAPERGQSDERNGAAARRLRRLEGRLLAAFGEDFEPRLRYHLAAASVSGGLEGALLRTIDSGTASSADEVQQLAQTRRSHRKQAKQQAKTTAATSEKERARARAKPKASPAVRPQSGYSLPDDWMRTLAAGDESVLEDFVPDRGLDAELAAAATAALASATLQAAPAAARTVPTRMLGVPDTDQPHWSELWEGGGPRRSGVARHGAKPLSSRAQWRDRVTGEAEKDARVWTSADQQSKQDRVMLEGVHGRRARDADAILEGFGSTKRHLFPSR